MCFSLVNTKYCKIKLNKDEIKKKYILLTEVECIHK